jgi:hypothetical protein
MISGQKQGWEWGKERTLANQVKVMGKFMNMQKGFSKFIIIKHLGYDP